MMSFLKAVNPIYTPGIDSFSPGSDLIWGSSSVAEILKSMDPEDSTPAGALPMDI